MTDGMSFKCSDCHMVFGSLQLLQKHKHKFCVGGRIGDPDALMLRKGLYSAETPSPRPLSPDRRPSQLVEYTKYNPNQDAQMRQLAESYGRNMEYLQGQNRDLERQREDIRKRLLELSQRGPQPTDNTAALLAELKAQEERNAKSLEDLRRRLYDMNSQRVQVIEVEKPGQNYLPPPVPQPAPPLESNRKSYVYPVYFGNSLVAEICAMRQAYLQNGGNDPEILARMGEMQAEAQAIEDNMKRNLPEKPDKKGGNNAFQLKMLEMENERMHKELLMLQEQNFNRKRSDREGELEDALRRLQEEQLRKMMQLQNEIELLKRQAMMPPPQQPTPRLPPPQPNNADVPWMLQQRPYVDVDSMQPYDQYWNAVPVLRDGRPYLHYTQ